MGIIAILALLGVVGIGFGRSQASKAREEDDYEKAQAAKLVEARAAAAAAELARRAALRTATRNTRLAQTPTTLRSKLLTKQTDTSNATTQGNQGISIRDDESWSHL